MTRQIARGAVLPGGGQHIAAWRHPDQPVDGATDVACPVALAPAAERRQVDADFLADALDVALGGGIEGGNAWVAGFAPVTLFAALAPVTRHLGFIATASTTYEEPYATPRSFASLGLTSGARAGWTTVTEAAARNVNRATPLPHAARHRRAAEQVAVVEALWVSCEDHASLRDRASGRYFHADRVHGADDRGEHFQVEGPLDVPRSPQRHPVIVQASQSEDGRDLAAATAEVNFTAHQHLDAAQAFHRDLKRRARARSGACAGDAGRRARRRRTEAEARDESERLTAVIVPATRLPCSARHRTSRRPAPGPGRLPDRDPAPAAPPSAEAPEG